MIIKEVKARSVRDSRGEKTIEVSVNGCKASSPSGKSRGEYESPQYHKDLKWNISFLNNWDDKIRIEGFWDLIKVEEIIKKKSKVKDITLFGANALFAFESAILKALAKSKRKQLWEIVNPRARNFPVPVGNVVGGGLHSLRFDIRPEFQEFLVLPRGKSFKESVEIMDFMHGQIGNEIGGSEKNDEGAWLTSKSNRQVLRALDKVRIQSQKKFKRKIGIGVDVAGSSFYHAGVYKFRTIALDKKDYFSYLRDLIVNYDVEYIEDPSYEEDFVGFKKIRKKVKKVIVGDDLTTTHMARVKKAIKKKSIGAVIVKPNQNGSLLRVARIIGECKKRGVKTVFSHRSGETMDDAIADYAFAFQADFIKTGVATKWRKVKLNRMIEIEEKLRKRKG